MRHDVRIRPRARPARQRTQRGRGVVRRSGFVAVEIPFTPRAKRVLELSLEEARTLGHNYIGTEHLLLGLLREGEGVAARVLENLGADPTKIRNQVSPLSTLHTPPHPTPHPFRRSPEPHPGFPHLIPNCVANHATCGSLLLALGSFGRSSRIPPTQPSRVRLAWGCVRLVGAIRGRSRDHQLDRLPGQPKASRHLHAAPPTTQTHMGRSGCVCVERLSLVRGRWTTGDPHGGRVRRDGGRRRRRTGGWCVAFPPRCPLPNTARTEANAGCSGIRHPHGGRSGRLAHA